MGEGGWFLLKAACKVTHGGNGAHGSAPCYDPDILFRFEANRSSTGMRARISGFIARKRGGWPVGVVVLDKPCTEK